MKKLEKKAILLESNLNVVSLKGHLIYKSILENVELPRTYIKVHKGKEIKTKCNENTLPLNQSLEVREIVSHLYTDKSFAKSFTLKKLEDGYKVSTNAIISVTFDKPLNDGEKDKKDKWHKTKTIATEKQVRAYVYENGFTYNDIKYVLYKRSSGNAKEGKCLFIREDLYAYMWKWSCLDYDFNIVNRYDISSLYAYSCLSLTNIHDLITIEPKNILLIDDVDTTVSRMASVSELVDGKIEVTDRITGIQSSCFDGQSLIDESIVNSSELYANKGTILLRNRFFKSNGINTKIQEYYAENGISTVYDMFDNPHDAKDILLITTPNSCKWLKFQNQFSNKEECYNYWLNTIDSQFGICKSEPTSKFGKYQRMSYQMVNTLPLNEDDVFKLASKTANDINKINTSSKKFIEYIKEDDVTITTTAIERMLEIAPKFEETIEFDNFKARYIDKRKKQCKSGKLLVKGDNMTLIGNPYMMLVRSYDTNYYNTFLSENECYCGYFKPFERVVGFRSPHITMGNVSLFYNRKVKVYDRWFNLTPNCVVINAYETASCQRLGGSDFDGDAMLLTNDKLVCKRALEVQDFLIPINEVKGEKKLRLLSELNEIDNLLHSNAIGLIVNASQKYNSLYWDTNDDKLKKEYYDKASALSSMSQIAIDLSKKMIDGLSLNREIMRYRADSTPKFFDVIVKKKKGYKKPSNMRKMKCPMDYLQNIKFARKPYGKGSDMIDLFEVQSSNNKEITYNKTQIEDIRVMIESYSKKMAYMSIKGVETDNTNSIKLELIEKLSKKLVNKTTLYFLMNHILKNEKWSEIRNLALSCVILAYNEELGKLTNPTLN